MKNFTLQLKSLILLAAAFQISTAFSQATASYNITFSSVWENETIDPINGNSTTSVPGNAHWSNLVGATHNSSYTMVEMGSLASTGIKDVAERGVNTALMAEVMNQVNTIGNADQWLQESFSPFAAISSASINGIVVSSDFPLLSLVSMIAPSPDWMIAINSVNLREGGTWTNEIIIPLFPYDAGTDSGTTYTSGDQPTVPAQPISIIVNQSPFNAKPIGTITITLDQVLSVENQNLSKVTLSPNPSNGLIQINTSNANILKEASVFDVLGKQVAAIRNSKLDSNFNMDLTALNNGIYLVRMELEDGSMSTKRIVLN